MRPSEELVAGMPGQVARQVHVVEEGIDILRPGLDVDAVAHHHAPPLPASARDDDRNAGAISIKLRDTDAPRHLALSG
jgi:hypothetical protein